MVTTVGTESRLPDLVYNLLELEYDAIAAYDSTIDKLENVAFKDQIADFKRDHLRHVSDLKQLATTIGVTPPGEGSAKQWLTQGKVAMAGLMGDKTVLKAMRSNEEDTVAAYERATRHEEATGEARSIFERGLADELRHREWMQRTSEQI